MKDKVHEILMELNRGRIAVSEAQEQLLDLFGVSGSCYENCALGDEGHCGRTEFEYLHHCKKLNNEGKAQRSFVKLNPPFHNCR